MNIFIKKSFSLTAIKLFIIFSIVAYFILGFVFQQDPSNGGKIDFTHIYHNYKLIKNADFFSIDWNDFESTSLPLYYLVASLLLSSNEILPFRFLALIISLSVPIILYFSLFTKFELIKKVDAVLLSSIVLLSSSFRTDSFFALEENIGFLILSLVILFFNRFQNNKNMINQFFLIFLSSLIFYTRQTYAFVAIIIFFELIDLKKILSKKNIYISLLFTLFLLPSLYFFYIWKGLVPPMAGSRIVGFDFSAIPIILNSYLIFLVPLIFFNIKKKDFILSKNFILLFIILFISFYFFSNFNLKSFGGGPIYKLLFINGVNWIAKGIFIFLSIVCLYIIFILSKKDKNFLLFFIFFSLILIFADNQQFSYFDPLIFILVNFLFNFKINNLLRTSQKYIFINIFYYFFLHLSWILYFQIYLNNAIR